MVESSSTTQPAFAASNAERPLSTSAEPTENVVKRSFDGDLDQPEPQDTIVSRQNELGMVPCAEIREEASASITVRLCTSLPA